MRADRAVLRPVYLPQPLSCHPPAVGIKLRRRATLGHCVPSTWLLALASLHSKVGAGHRAQTYPKLLLLAAQPPASRSITPASRSQAGHVARPLVAKPLFARTLAAKHVAVKPSSSAISKTPRELCCFVELITLNFGSSVVVLLLLFLYEYICLKYKV
jgi:hypothetical protein